MTDDNKQIWITEGTICLERGWETAEQFLHRIFARYSSELEELIMSAKEKENAKIWWKEDPLFEQLISPQEIIN
jgi:hypothetical protein